MKLLPNGLSRSIGKQVLKTKKNSPHIFFATGLIGVVAGTVLACRATLKLPEAVDGIREDFDNVTDMSGYDEVGKQKYSQSQYRRDVGYVYMKGGVKLIRLYAPAAIVGGLGVASLTGSHIQLTKRNAALSATLAAVSKAYEAYRQRVAEELGEERERELHRDTRKETVEENGKKKVVQTSDPNRYSAYAKIFDESNAYFKKDAELNRIFVQAQQNYANHILHSKGWILLNDVYELLGFEKTRAGTVVGWYYGGNGDDYVDFGIFEAQNSHFVNGYERSIILDFNVDGNIYELI